MNRKIFFWYMLFFISGAAFFLTGCGKDSTESGQSRSSSGSNQKSEPETVRESVQQSLLPQASGAVVYGNDTISIDASNTGEGYVMVRYASA